MRIAYPAPLKHGDRIAVPAPSSGVEPALHPRLDLAVQHLRDLGFVVEEGPCLRTQWRDASAPAEQRAAELMGFLLRDDVAAVIPPWGGELAIEVLDLLDWPALRAAKPKWYLGYSDNSTLMLPLTLNVGWATAHGPCLMDLVPSQADPLTSQALSMLAGHAGSTVRQVQSVSWELNWTDFEKVPAAPYSLTEPTAWRELRGAAQVDARGRLIGGCLDTLAHLAGGRHGNVRAFAGAHAHEGTILFLENAEQSPTALVRALHTLRWAGWFEHLSGLLIGRSAGPDSAGDGRLRYADALLSALSTLTCPILVDMDIGHKPPQMLLINGALARVRWSRSDGGAIEQDLL